MERAKVRVREIEECIRLGLIGAGMDRKQAARHARRASEEVDITNRNLLCLTILSNAFKGKPHDPLGEAEGEVTSASASPEYTETAPPSDTPPSK